MKRIDPTLDAAKRTAAARAAEAVENKMVLGLGSGSTASIAIQLIGQRVAQGLDVTGIPTSERTAALARDVGIPLTDFSRHRRIDLTIDGADQIEEGRLSLIKGLGGALLREKIVAEASKRMIVVADHTKLVKQLGSATALPVEIVPFGWELAVRKLETLGCAVALRHADGRPFVTDGGNFVADCTFQAISNADRLHASLGHVPALANADSAAHRRLAG